MARLKLIIIILLTLLPHTARSQKHGSKTGADVRAGYVFPSHKFLQGRNQARKPINSTVSAHLKYGFHLDPYSELGRKYPSTYQGLGVSFHHFFNDRELGSPFGIYIFQHSRIASISPELSLDFEWSFGIICNWKKYDRQSNPYNRLMGSSMTAYMNPGLMLNWNFAPLWNMNAGLDFAHVSNGNTAYPNYGLNTLTARAGITRSFNPEPSVSSREPDDFRRHVTYDLILYGAWRKKVVYIGISEYALNRSFAIAGLNFNPMYNVCRWFRTGLSLDMLHDRSSNIKSHITSADRETKTLQYDQPPFREQFMVGLSARLELVMPIFSINAGIGGHIIANGEDRGLPYEVIALKTSVSKNLYLHVGCIFYNMQMSRCLMLGLGYRFNSRG